MSSLRKKPDHFQVGATRLKAGNLNELVELGTRSIRGPGVSDFGDRTVVNAQQELVSRGKQKFPFIVLEEDFDWLVCTPYIPSGFSGWLEADDPNDPVVANALFPPEKRVYIAKPYLLQKTPHDGKEYTLENGDVRNYEYDNTVRSVRKSFGSDISHHEEEHITPDYFAGDIIWAIQGVTNLYEPNPTMYSAVTATGTPQPNEILVSADFYARVQIGTRLRILVYTSSGGTGGVSTEEYIGADVVAKSTVGGVYTLLLELDQLDSAAIMAADGAAISVGIETAIYWQDSNDAGRTWEAYSRELQSFFKFVSLTARVGDYYIARHQISRTTETGTVVWGDIVQGSPSYALVQLTNNAPANSELSTIYCGFLSKGPRRKINAPGYGDLELWDGFELPGSSGSASKTPFVEFISNQPSATYPTLYNGYYHVENLNTTNGTVEVLKTRCYLNLKTPNLVPTVGRPYLSTMVSSPNNKINGRFVFSVALDCCDVGIQDGYYSDSGDGPPDDHECPPCYAWDNVLGRCVWICGPPPVSCECVPGHHPPFNVAIGDSTRRMTYDATLGFYVLASPSDGLVNECIRTAAGIALWYTCNASGDEEMRIEIYSANYCVGYVDLVISDCDPWTATGSLSFQDIGPKFGQPPDSCTCDETTVSFPVTVTKD